MSQSNIICTRLLVCLVVVVCIYCYKSKLIRTQHLPQRSFTKACPIEDSPLLNSASASLIFDSGFFFTEAPIPFREQNLTFLSYLCAPRITGRYITHVNPWKTHLLLLAGTSRRSMSMRNKWKNFSKSFWFVAIVTRIKSSVPFLRAIASICV